MTTRKNRKFHSPEFRAKALKLAEKTRASSAAKELERQESQLYIWRTAANRKKSVSERGSVLQVPNPIYPLDFKMLPGDK
ncbi:transposase [Endozoicomonas numazuensis]|uniref:transposase n=1 Tax=Endozoicomonas numazuensis TaxID=1137799 RepID=UPI000689E104|nr:transposase [Endozoicomonas numazuensis]